jgi:general secretion pathway protein D
VASRRQQTPGGGAPDAASAPITATGEGVKIVADVPNNAVLVYSTYSTFTRIRDFLKTVDVAQAQVVIEATVAEVNLTDALQYGVETYLQTGGLMSARSGTDTAPTSPSAGGLGLQGSTAIGTVQLNAVMQALQSVTTVKVISSPYLTVVDSKTARLVIGDQIPFANRTVNSTTQGTATVTQEVEVKDTGIVLEVTPKIHPDNSVLLNVSQTVSKPDSTATSGNLTPVISTREVKSDIIVQSGRTILIGGLIQDRLDRTVSAVPVVSKIPVIGDLFSQKTDTSTKVELIIMITPRVIRRSADLENVTRMLRSQLPIR